MRTREAYLVGSALLLIRHALVSALMVAVALMAGVDHSMAHSSHGDGHVVAHAESLPDSEQGDPAHEDPLGCCMIDAHCSGVVLVGPAYRSCAQQVVPLVLSAPAHDLLLPGLGVAPERKPPKRSV